MPSLRIHGIGVNVAPLASSSCSCSGLEVPLTRLLFVDAVGMTGSGKADKGEETETIRSSARRYEGSVR